MMVDLPREIALKILYDININNAYSNIALNRQIETYDLKKVEIAFITELVYGTIQWQLTIDYIIQKFSSIKIKKISPWIINILRLGVYQIIYLDRVPESAACNESVSLSKKYGHSTSSRFVNAVLRNIVRNKEVIEFPDKDKNLINFLSIKYSHPEWMVKEWVKRFGSVFTEELLISNNKLPDFCIRVNTLKITKDKLLEQFVQGGIDYEKGKYIEEAVIIKNPSGIAKIDAFKKGFFQIQDESSMLVAKILDPKPGELVMDICSAPGGKATHIAELMNNIGTVIARDVHLHKIALIKEAAKRLGINILKTELFDASEIDVNYLKAADKVLVDAPCSGLGIINRKPDIKWARSIEDKKELTALQLKILKNASEYVKYDGTLVYSTCTIEWEENEGVIKEFIKSNSEFYLEDLTPNLSSKIIKATAKEGFIQLYPNIDKVDGFFIAKLKRRRQ
jgi:16S rRNA (cytosine967-C5)-methyltransferase